MRKLTFFILVVLFVECVAAQSLEERYRAFQQAAKQDYTDFRDAANARYADFLRAAWEYYTVSPAIPHPEEVPVPPVIYDDKQQQDDKQIKGDQVPQPSPAPIPQPVAPIIS